MTMVLTARLAHHHQRHVYIVAVAMRMPIMIKPPRPSSSQTRQEKHYGNVRASFVAAVVASNSHSRRDSPCRSSPSHPHPRLSSPSHTCRLRFPSAFPAHSRRTLSALGTYFARFFAPLPLLPLPLVVARSARGGGRGMDESSRPGHGGARLFDVTHTYLERKKLKNSSRYVPYLAWGGAAGRVRTAR